jgi:NitT/TauT family transport system permease protein
MKAGPAARIVPPLAVFVAAIVAWDLLIRLARIPSFLLPRPMEVLRSIVVDRLSLVESLGWTTLAAIIGFAASAVIGMLIALLLSTSALLRRAVYPYTLFFQTVPIIAIAPMLIFWFEPGVTPVAICAFIVSVFPVIANTLAGLRSTDPALVDLFRLYGAGPISGLWKLRLPWALPGIFTGLRIAAGLAVIGTLVSEIFVGPIEDREGLGVKLYNASKQARPDLTFAAVLLASLLGLAMFGAVNLAAHLALRRWHASEQ